MELCIDDVLCFAEEALERGRPENVFYKRDHELGTFESMLETCR